MKALILAAGYATRLYPLTKEYPKALLKVKEKPIINYIINKLEVINEISEIIVVTNSKFISQFRKWKSELHTQKSVSLVDDLTKNHRDRRGAIGDMNFAIVKKRIRDNLLVIGGDNLFDNDLKGFFSFAKNKRPNPIIGAYDIKDICKVKHYGVIKLDSKFKIVDFKEKPKKPKSTLVAMCLYYFPREKLGLIKEYLNPVRNTQTNQHDASGLYIDWLRERVPVYGFVFGGRWYDIGDYKFYNEAKERFLKEEKKYGDA